MEKTIAQELSITKLPFTITNDNGDIIYRERENGKWYREEYSKPEKPNYHECSEKGVIMDNRAILTKLINRFNKKPKTIAQRLGVKSFPFKIYSDNGDLVYHENSSGLWFINVYNSDNKLVKQKSAYY